MAAYRDEYPVAGHHGDREGVAFEGIALDVTQVGGIELAVIQTSLQRHFPRGIFRNLQQVMDHRGRTGGYLMVIQGHEDILPVAPVDAPAFAVQDVGIGKIRPRVDRATVIRPINSPPLLASSSSQS